MAGNGFPPEPGSRRYQEKSRVVPLLLDGKIRGPELPRYSLFKKPDGKPMPWCAATKRWWAGWRRSPQAMRMTTDADWEFLLETAVIHHQFWAEGRLELAAELRIRQAKFGATPEDRARLRVEISGPSATLNTNAESPDPMTQQSLDARRARILAQGPGPASLDEKRSKKVLDTLDEFGS